MLDLADVHYRIRLMVCSLRQNNPVVLYSALLFGPMIAGWAIMETTNPGIVNMEEEHRQGTPLAVAQSDSQKEQLREMLSGLKDLSMTEKLEAASDAHSKFMGCRGDQVFANNNDE